jgi:hypothetical protein
MSLAHIETARSAHIARTDPTTAPAAPRIRAVPEGTEARGFVLYVGIDEAKAAAAGTSLHRIVEALKALTADIAPSSETYAAVAIAPSAAGGRDVDVVRLALQDPAALARHRTVADDADRAPGGVVVDISRKRVILDSETASLTYKEFELLQYLVLRGTHHRARRTHLLALGRRRRGRCPQRAHHRRARPAPSREARPLRGHRAHRARRRLPVRSSRRRVDPPREHAQPRPALDPAFEAAWSSIRHPLSHVWVTCSGPVCSGPVCPGHVCPGPV